MARRLGDEEEREGKGAFGISKERGRFDMKRNRGGVDNKGIDICKTDFVATVLPSFFMTVWRGPSREGPRESSPASPSLLSASPSSSLLLIELQSRGGRGNRGWIPDRSKKRREAGARFIRAIRCACVRARA